MDGYQFGMSNFGSLQPITGPESDVLLRACANLGSRVERWAELDANVYRVLWEWDCTHQGLRASKCIVTVIINASCRSIQLSRLQLYAGRGHAVYGSSETGFDSDNNIIGSGGYASVLVWGHSPSPLEDGLVFAKVRSSAFDMAISGALIETVCTEKHGFHIGFLEKSVSEWWGKYVLLIRS